MGKQLLIDQNLFLELVRYHCLEIRDDEVMNQHIATELEAKLKKQCDRLEYSKQLALLNE